MNIILNKPNKYYVHFVATLKSPTIIQTYFENTAVNE